MSDSINTFYQIGNNLGFYQNGELMFSVNMETRQITSVSGESLIIFREDLESDEIKSLGELDDNGVPLKLSQILIDNFC